MDVLAILALVEKGLTIATALIQAGKSEGAQQAIKAVTDFVTGAKTAPPTDDDFTKVEDTLDALLDEFNVELPPV